MNNKDYIEMLINNNLISQEQIRRFNLDNLPPDQQLSRIRNMFYQEIDTDNEMEKQAKDLAEKTYKELEKLFKQNKK